MELVEKIMHKFSVNYKLKKVIDYLDEVGNPQNEYKAIHIGGTNGKGSTTTMISDILEKAGYKVGKFISPAIISHYERCSVNDVWITREQFEYIYRERESLIIKHDLSYFEIWAVVMFEFFKDQKVDYAVVEVGLGGEKDATNVMDNVLATVITSISRDHVHFLGDNLNDIAKTKSKIIKGKPCYTSIDNPEIHSILKEETNDLNICKPSNISVQDNNLKFMVNNEEFLIPNALQIQAFNASVAINICSDLQVPLPTIKLALSDFKLHGRNMKLRDNPLLICDGAHNIEGIEQLVKHYKNKGYKVLFSMLADKDYEESEELLSQIGDVFVTNFNNPRAFDFSKRDNYIEDWKKFLDEQKEPIIVTGSLYFISEIIKYVKKDK